MRDAFSRLRIGGETPHAPIDGDKRDIEADRPQVQPGLPAGDLDGPPASGPVAAVDRRGNPFALEVKDFLDARDPLSAAI